MLAPQPVTVADLRPRQPAIVAAIDWPALGEGEARRLREFGLDEGVEIELMHKGLLRGGPIACRIGRMTVAVRAHVATAIRVA